MARTLDLTWNGLHLTLDADRAALARDTRDLLIADVHLGKAAAFRAHASPVPESVTGADLDRLTRLIDRHAPARLVVLGDLLHAREAHNPATLDAIRRWRDAHRALPILLIRGNHDTRAGDPPPELGFDCVDPPYPLGPIDLDHHPPTNPKRPTIAGHIHPAVTLRGRTRAHGVLRTRCFWFADQFAVLPAFGAFTGSDTIRPNRSDRIFAVNDDTILEIRSAASDPPSVPSSPSDPSVPSEISLNAQI